MTQEQELYHIKAGDIFTLRMYKFVVINKIGSKISMIRLCDFHVFKDIFISDIIDYRYEITIINL